MNQSIKILLIDDNLADVELTKETLVEGRLNADVFTTWNGAEALDYLQRACVDAALPDLILLDLNMPELDGPGLLVELAKHERLRTIPVIMLASSDDEQDIARSYALGAAYYVTKPLGFSEFQRSVRTVEDFWLGLASHV